MNTPYDKTSAADAARMLGTSPQTVTTWCRTGKINASDVSDGTGKARWLLSDDEVQYIMDLKKKFGSVRDAMTHYKKNWKDGKKPAVQYNVMPETRNYIPQKKKDEPKNTPVDSKSIAATIDYIQQVKARIADCKEELALLEKEYEDLKKEVISTL